MFLAQITGLAGSASQELRSTDANWNERVAGLGETIERSMRAHRVPGLSIALIRDAAVAWSRGFGVRDAETRQPVDPRTIFEAASMSKPVFAYAVMNSRNAELSTWILR